MKSLRKLAKGVASVMALVMAFSVVFSANLTTQAATESKEIFSGGTNESYESDDASWLLNADDSDVIKIVYTCTEKANAGWGVLGWGATVDGNWKDGPSLAASETDATAQVVAKVTAGDLKKTLGIKDGSDVTFIKLGAWNGGKIESLSISGAGAASVDSSASTESAAAEEVVIQAPAELTGDYLYLIDEAKTITIWPDLYAQYWVPGQTITLRIEMESNGSFGGCLGTCVNKWAWQMEEFSSDTGSTITVEWFLTPIMNNIQLQFWWLSGTQVGIKSIEVIKAYEISPFKAPVAEEEEKPSASAAHSGSISLNTTENWTNNPIAMSDLIGDVDPASISSIVFTGDTNFQVGYNGPSGWTQHEGTMSYVITDIDFSDSYYLHIGVNAVTDKTVSWNVYTDGTASGGDSETEVPDEESNIKTATYTYDMSKDGQNESFNFDLYTYFPDLKAGDQVKISADFSTPEGWGWYGGELGISSSAAADGNWDKVAFDNSNNSVSITATVKYDGSNGGNVTLYWIGGENATVNLTFEKLN